MEHLNVQAIVALLKLKYRVFFIDLFRYGHEAPFLKQFRVHQVMYITSYCYLNITYWLGNDMEIPDSNSACG